MDISGFNSVSGGIKTFRGQTESSNDDLAGQMAQLRPGELCGTQIFRFRSVKLGIEILVPRDAQSSHL